MYHKRHSNDYKGVTLSLSLPVCLATHIVLISNQHFTCFTPFHLYVEIHFYTAGRPGPCHWPLVPSPRISHCYRDWALPKSQFHVYWSFGHPLLQCALFPCQYFHCLIQYLSFYVLIWLKSFVIYMYEKYLLYPLFPYFTDFWERVLNFNCRVLIDFISNMCICKQPGIW